MTVKTLLEKLTECDGDDLVVMSIDPEGNGFRVVEDVDPRARYEDGETGQRELSPSMIESGYGPEDVMVGGQPCVVLWP